MSLDTRLLTHKDWVLRVSCPKVQPTRLMLLLHGWTGDENSMWIFTRKLSADDTLVSPRAPFSSGEGGYSWREVVPGSWGAPALGELEPAVQSLVQLVDEFRELEGIQDSRINLMGFSQGGAVVNSFALLYPDRVHRAAVLSGFIPGGAEELISAGRLKGIAFFVAHGSQDNLVPVEQAEQSVSALKRAGAVVTYCHSEVGHRVSTECLKSLEEFFSK
ncbi:MAG: alpha/beta fold hydrolase [Anaerolineales bacterium]|nr:alpha/beta fold hydrolase [Anaerolineales bacterium]